MKKSLSLMAGASALAVLLSACGGGGSAGDEESVDEIVFSVWETGMTGTLPLVLADDEEIQEEFGVNVSALTTPNLPEVYQNLLVGRAHANVGAPETMASLRGEGGDIRIGGVVAPNTVSILGPEGDFSLEDLKGSRLAAITSSGAWAILTARLEAEGIDVDEDLEVVSVSNTLTGAA
ncbi:hypothetical protein [Nocardiopsis sp. ATB16-24]|uniref:hypothetical protein n=1 Tax=Nocardiopsis sp. ATB16-24 TaxID=3019555 RepID=UPI002556F7D6|nr:hypothetical protein [Nocardiopsis sp. ATB16-24]